MNDIEKALLSSSVLIEEIIEQIEIGEYNFEAFETRDYLSSQLSINITLLEIKTGLNWGNLKKEFV